MEEIRKNKKVIFLCIFLVLVTCFIAFMVSNKDSVSTKREGYLRNYKVNEIVKMYVSKEDIPSYYLADYLDLLSNNFEEAYERVDNHFKIKMNIKDIDDFKKYYDENIFAVNMLSRHVKNYYVDINNKKRYYFVFDNNGYTYVFKENSIMDYTVFFDKNLVDY